MTRRASLKKAVLFFATTTLATTAGSLCGPARAQLSYYCPPDYYYDPVYGCTPLSYFYGPPYYVYPPAFGFGFFYGPGWRGHIPSPHVAPRGGPHGFGGGRR